MGSLYERADLFDLLDSDDKYNGVKKHWEKVLEHKNVHSLLDISIGTGGLTLPLAEMGIQLSGSDLSDTMMKNCREKADKLGLNVDLRKCDFRELKTHFQEKFDCVASTGNSLPYVTNDEVLQVLEDMDSLINDGGYLYFDIRNWDKILKEQGRFYLYNPIFHDDMRINLIQVWDYNEDGSMTFNILYTFEKDGKIFDKAKFEEHYLPIGRKIIIDKLKEMGYKNIEIQPFPSTMDRVNADEADWYCVIAQK